MSKIKVLHLAVALLIVFSLFFPGGPVRAQGGPAEDHAGGRDKGVELTLRADGAPLPGGTAKLSIEATPLLDAPELEFHWVIPEAVQLLEAEYDTFSDAPMNQAVASQRTLSFPTAGTYKIAVSVTLRIAPEQTYGTSGVLFFIIDPNGSRVTDKDPDAHRPARSGPENEVIVYNTPADSTQNSPNDDPCFTIFVHATRIEYPVTKDGYGTPYTIPLAGVGIEFRESDTVFDDSYGTLGTDANGFVAGSFCDDDGPFGGDLEIYLRITAERGDPIVYVEDTSYFDEKYEYDTDVQSSGGGTLDFYINLGYNWSSIFNIVDAAWLARELWLNSGGSFDHETEIHWEPGYGEDGSYYNPTWEEITIADNPSNPDQWDELPIMHEWSHSADDYYSCDENPGGDHSWNEIIDSEMAWSEGYADYYPSAVRAVYGFPDANYYIDVDGAGTAHKKNLETCYDCPVTIENEGALARALWDLNDSGIDGRDGQDQVGYGHAAIQSVYISDVFYDIAYGDFDDTCNFDTYMRGWIDYGNPHDYQTAASVKQNTGYTLTPGKLIAENSTDASITSDYSAVDIYRWWNQLTYVADNSFSMNGPKFSAMQTLFKEAVNDLGGDPIGTEFTLELFNNTNIANQPAFAGQFYPESLIEPINALTTISDADPNCEVNALLALAQAVDDKEKGDVWLFTDGDTTQSPSVENLRQVLNENQLRASMALMGLCAKGENTTPPGPVSTEMLEGLAPEEQQALMSERLTHGQARGELGLMADDVPGGLVPYLLTAINSGGQFLYVDESQVEDAADILLAQITNSAGAGRWSDYVSDQATYQWDYLDWEFEWIDARLGENRGNPTDTQQLDLILPSPHFEYYNHGPFSVAHVFEDGYITFGNYNGFASNNTELPNPAVPNNVVYPYWDNIKPYCPPGEASSAACQGFIYTIQEGDWYVIEYDQYQYNQNEPLIINTFEVLLNLETGEIRYQYQTGPACAESATIGLENGEGNDAVQISYNDENYGCADTGYKFTPAPPQPSKTYAVAVDSTMEAIGFLLTGYSGSFEPLAVTTPDGAPVNCATPGTLCLDLDLVQYVQVNTYDRVGDWHAVVDAGNTGSGTYSFTSFATSPIAVENQNDHTLPTGTQQLLVEVTGQVDNCELTGLFHELDGSPVGYSIGFHDDGMHNDGEACDGVYGSGSFYLGVGSVYLTLKGYHNGEEFVRIDPVPYSFQPIEFTSLGDGANFGGVTELQFQLSNNSLVDHCYWVTYDAPEGWWIDFGWLPIACMDAGHSATVTYDVYMTDGTSNYLHSGTTGIITISLTEIEKGEISDSASARITRHRPPYNIHIFNPTNYLRPNGDSAVIEYFVTDIQGVAVADGTTVQLIANTGEVDPMIVQTEQGSFTATYTSGSYLGTAIIMAQTDNDVTASTEIEIINPLPDQITLSVSDNQLPADGISTATLVATVRDQWGDPVPNQLVQIGVEGDGQMGTLTGGEEVIIGHTDASGQMSTVFTSGLEVGVVGVRAELFYDEGSGNNVVDHDRRVIFIGGNLFRLPLVFRR